MFGEVFFTAVNDKEKQESHEQQEHKMFAAERTKFIFFVEEVWEHFSRLSFVFCRSSFWHLGT